LRNQVVYQLHGIHLWVAPARGVLMNIIRSSTIHVWYQIHILWSFRYTALTLRPHGYLGQYPLVSWHTSFGAPSSVDSGSCL
jgi:hypothetical protein